LTGQPASQPASRAAPSFSYRSNLYVFSNKFIKEIPSREIAPIRLIFNIFIYLIKEFITGTRKIV